jgi:transcriptional regulator with XRE-family HTH domain
MVQGVSFMKSLGSHFKRNREEKGYSIDDVAEATNIASRYIEAIEDHDFSQFPADVYAKGFIRSYAEFLDLDAQSLVMEYSLNFEDNHAEESDDASSNRLLYWLSVTAITAIVCALLLLRFAFLSTDSTVPRHIPRPAQSGAQPEASSSQSLSVNNETETLKLRAVASGKTWVYAIFDGMRKQEFMFQPGDEMVWSATDTIRLRMGNAGGLRLYHDGKKLPSLGKTGEVADRIITLNNGKINVKSAR